MNNPAQERLMAEHDARHTSKAITIWKLIFTVCDQSSGAPMPTKLQMQLLKLSSGVGMLCTCHRGGKIDGDRCRGKALCIGLLRRA
jgi:hypothetical protein